MPAKRSLSTTASEHDDSGTPSPSSSPSPTKPTSSKPTSKKRGAGSELPTAPKAKSRKTTTTPTSGGKVSGGASGVDWSAIEGSTPEKREALVNHLISVGASTVGTSNLAEMYNLPLTAVKNAIQAGKPGNLRSKILKAARGDKEQ